MGNTKSKSKSKSSTVINISNAKETETVTPVNEAASNDPITTPIPQSLPLPNTSRTENETKHERGGGSTAVASMQLQGTSNAVDRDMSECTNVVSSDILNDILNCSNCNKPFKLQDDRHQFLCPCKTTHYCNTVCQKAHWKVHKSKHREIVKKDTLVKDDTGSIKKKTNNKSSTQSTLIQFCFGSDDTVVSSTESKESTESTPVQQPQQHPQQPQNSDDSDSNKKESTNSETGIEMRWIQGGNNDTPSTSSSKPKDIIHDDLCSICFDDVSILNETFVQYSCCGKVMHLKCFKQLRGTKSVSRETRNSCPMCRAPNVDQESKEHIERLQKWSRRNRSWAQFSLGCLYDQGLGVKEDSKRACELWKLAADQGHHLAQFSLGCMYAQDQDVFQSLNADSIRIYNPSRKGIEQSDTEAVKFYRLAADQGYHKAQFNLASMYQQGRGVIQSDSLALKFFKLCAEAGIANAQSVVGTYYANGQGVEQSFTEAREWMAKAAKQVHEEAIKNLKQLDEFEGIKYAKARFLHFMKGMAYAHGQGVIQSDALAFKYFKLAAEQGDAGAQCNVGNKYYLGTGVEQSFTEATKWWTKAAKQGSENAITLLKMLDEQEGIKSTSSSSNYTDNSTVLCSKCNQPAQTNRTLRSCKCKGAQYCNNSCYQDHWKDHKAEHNRLVKLLPSTGETKEEPTEDKKTKKQKPNDRCACGSKKKYKKCCGSKKR